MKAGQVVGSVLFVAAAAAIWLWPERNAAVGVESAVRPIRSFVVVNRTKMPDVIFTGSVDASATRKLSFKQAGRIQRIPVTKGQKVKKGERLAWLDPADFEQRLAKAEAAEKFARVTFERKSEAAKKNAISKQEVSLAETQLKEMTAQLELTRRALADTVLYAPFDGTVADVPASELDLVSGGAEGPVVVIQDTSVVNIDVAVPETFVIRAPRMEFIGTGACCRVSFDSVPGRTYPITFKEFRAVADTRNQTYVGTYELKNPPADLLLMPGMSATIVLDGQSYVAKDEKTRGLLVVPESCVGVAADGSHFIWRLEPAQEGVFAVKKTTVRVVSRTAEGVVLADGVKPGDRLAAAGVQILDETDRVRLLED